MAQVNFYAAARAASGQATLQVTAETLASLISELSGRNPELAKLLPTCSYLLNGESCEIMEQPLSGNDNIDVLPNLLVVN